MNGKQNCPCLLLFRKAKREFHIVLRGSFMTCAIGRGIKNLMPVELRQTGIEALGEMPWGAHLCHFYETKQDLLDILIPYFKAGLESNEFCLWVIPQSLSVAEATRALQESVPEF